MRHIIGIIIFISAIRTIKQERAKSGKKINFKTPLKWLGGICCGLVVVALIVGMLEQKREESFTQEERIYRELVSCQDKVRTMLEAQYPTNSDHPMYWRGPTSFNHKLYEENAERNLEIGGELYQSCDSSVIDIYQLSSEELKTLKQKALHEDWITKMNL